MAEIKEILAGFVEVANNPKAQLDKYLAEGKRVIGVGPYHVPRNSCTPLALYRSACGAPLALQITPKSTSRRFIALSAR